VEKKAEEDLKPSKEGLGDKIRAGIETNFSHGVDFILNGYKAVYGFKIFFFKKKKLWGQKGWIP
jgi:hypothetical protein